MLNFSENFKNRMKNLLNDEYDAFINSLSCAEQKAVFVNTNKISVQDFKNAVDFDISPIDYEKNGFYVSNEKLGRHPLHHAGAFYIQEPSAMFTVNAFKFNGDEYVLDMCAAPGGKSIQIANKINAGLLVCNEINKARSEVLFSNIERMGLKNVVICSDTPENISKAYANCFDVVLVDAPCSGEGMFRRGEYVVNEWNDNLPQMCAARQKQILEQANIALKTGGHLIYSTCTYSVEENEGVIKQFLNEHNYQLEYIDAPKNFTRGVDMAEAVRLYPHKVKGEGQFVALLKKQEANENMPNRKENLQISRPANEFLKKYTTLNFDNAYEYKGNIYSIKDTNYIKKGVNYVSLGVKLGRTKKNATSFRFEPEHNLFTAFGKNFKQQINSTCTSEKTKAYLKGESIEADGEGYGVFLIENCPVGGFKLANKQAKNHYPKGLRNFK